MGWICWLSTRHHTVVCVYNLLLFYGVQVPSALEFFTLTCVLFVDIHRREQKITYMYIICRYTQKITENNLWHLPK